MIVAIYIIYTLGFWVFGHMLDMPGDTEGFYAPVAESLAKGDGYTIDGKFATSYPPLYPLLLASIYIFTGEYGTTNIVYPYCTIFLQSFSCGLLFLIANLLFHKRIAFLASMMYAAYPFFVILSVTKYTWVAMPLFTALFFISLFIFIIACREHRMVAFALSGFSLGLSGLVWPAVLFLWIPMSIFGVISVTKSGRKNGGIKIILCFVLSYWIPVLLWSAIIYQNTGQVILLSNNQVVATRDGIFHREGSQLREYEFAQDAYSAMKNGGMNNMKDIMKFCVDETSQKPAAAISFAAFKLFRPWYGTDSERYELPILMIQLPYLLIGMYGFYVARRKNLFATYLSLTIVLYFWFVSFTVLSILRYMLSAMGIVIMFCAVGIEDLIPRMKRLVIKEIPPS
ncbi:MAG: glycosyltransferase family 39 protein [Candidatus Omnitrophica bacterium]|nr:glycosyltransferase family 39 protein [Candidatus Omnitrophota bacterium]